MAGGSLTVRVEPWGPGAAELRRATEAARGRRDVAEALAGAPHRLLASELVWPEPPQEGEPTPPSEFRLQLYDYRENRLLQVRGPLDDPARAEVAERRTQPVPDIDEWHDAVEIARGDPELGDALRQGALMAYRPMPPVSVHESEEGEPERTVLVGLLPAGGGGHRHEIVGVNMTREALERFPDAAPRAARAAPGTCGPPNAFQGTTPRGTPGAARITVRRGDTTLWRLIATRPAASGGTVGSGIDLRSVDHRGRRVLRRGHVPILNVRYEQDMCGPFRDWQWQEGRFHAPGDDVAPGFRLCAQPPTTMLDTGVDQGNFAGVAVYVAGEEVVLVSELEAGWYRYISEWRFAADGVIRPRFGFAAAENSCVCTVHRHHAYWRLNIDIGARARNRVQEFNDPANRPPSWRTLRYETRRPAAPAATRRWRVIDAGGRGYELVPGPDDGVADPFGVGDLWALRLRQGEVDDGQDFTTDPALARAQLDRFLTGERIDPADVVLWYAAHFAHDLDQDEGPGHGHVVGPELRPVGW